MNNIVRIVLLVTMFGLFGALNNNVNAVGFVFDPSPAEGSGSGDITSVIAGRGLAGGGLTGSVTVHVDTTVVAGDGIGWNTASEAFNIFVNYDGGLETSNDSLQVKIKTSGGLATSSDGAYVDSTGWIVTVTDISDMLTSADINTYSELNTIVSDVTLTHNGLIDLSSELIAIVSDETGTGSLVFGTSPTFTTKLSTPEIDFIDSDASPNGTGEMRYDNVVTGISGGMLEWYDNDGLRYLVDLVALPSDDDYVVAYDADADGFYMKADETGVGGVDLDIMDGGSVISGAPTALDFLGADFTVTDATTADSINISIANGALDDEYVELGDSFGGDVTGTYDNIAITDDSHNHVIGNVDNLSDSLSVRMYAADFPDSITANEDELEDLLEHDDFSDYVANEHINHTSVTLTAGDGLVGGGDISSNRTFAVLVDSDGGLETVDDSLNVKDDGIKDEHIDWSDVTATDIPVDTLGTPTYYSVQNLSNVSQAAGTISGCDFTAGTAGSLFVAACTGIIKTSNSAIGVNKFFDLASDTLVVDNNSISYIYVDYNSGSPIFGSETTKAGNGRTKFFVGKVYREDDSIILLEAGQSIAEATKRIQSRLNSVDGEVVRSSGLVLGETGARNITTTAGIIYAGLTSKAIDATDTSDSDTFKYYYYTGAAWTYGDSTQISNINYNDIETGLEALNVNRYGVHWVFMDYSGDVSVIFGQGNYTLAGAEAAQPPSSLPDYISEFSILIGKIIIQQDEASFYSIESAFAITFVGTTSSDHGSLAGLSDDDHTQYLLRSDFSDSVAVTASTELSDTADLLYEAELDDESELEGQIGDVSNIYTNNDFTYTDYMLLAAFDDSISVTSSTELTDTADILYETELDSESELEGQLSDVSNVYTNKDFAYTDYFLLASFDDSLAVHASTELSDTADLLYEAELDDESELEGQLGDVSNVYTNNDFTYTDYMPLAAFDDSIAVTASTELTDTADLLYEAELDSESELESQLSDVTNVYTNNDFTYTDYMLSASFSTINTGTDPDVDATKEISIDTNGASGTTTDIILRGYDGSNQVALARKLFSFQGNVVLPNSLVDATRDKAFFYRNLTGMKFTITRIDAMSDTDDSQFVLHEYGFGGFDGATVIDTINCATGPGPYTDTETTITHAEVEAGHMICIDFDDTDTPGQVHIVLTGWLDADFD